MAKTAEIVLGEKTFTVHEFNLGELEDIGDAIGTMPPAKLPFLLLKMALKRAEPAIEDHKAIEATTVQVRAAMDVLLKLAGLEQPAGNPPTTEAAG